ncbi:hypothetical protein ACIA8G_31770 [Lentzea sp. NPDC051213]|uniref:hypothetical protein n=1 Tax=Lentzea sp. NPDC051213 TaxID=3364126 RepID=UPI0037A7DB97
MPVQDVYFLALHEPYQTPEYPVLINATIVHARTLLHPALPQPDGGRMFRCLTEFPVRTPGCVVPLSTLTFELNGGRWWPEVADWQRVVDAVVHVSRTKGCDALPLGLPAQTAAYLAQGPTTGPPERQEALNDITAQVHKLVEDGPLFPGPDLVMPPDTPETLPYRPWDGRAT